MAVLVKYKGKELKIPAADKITAAEIAQKFGAVFCLIKSEDQDDVEFEDPDFIPPPGVYKLVAISAENKKRALLDAFTPEEVVESYGGKTQFLKIIKSTPQDIKTAKRKLKDKGWVREGGRCAISGTKICTEDRDVSDGVGGIASHLVPATDIDNTVNGDIVPQALMDIFGQEKSMSIKSIVLLTEEWDYYINYYYVCINGTKIEYSEEAKKGIPSRKGKNKIIKVLPSQPENIRVSDSPDWPPPAVFAHHRAEAHKKHNFSAYTNIKK